MIKTLLLPLLSLIQDSWKTLRLKPLGGTKCQPLSKHLDVLDSPAMGSVCTLGCPPSCQSLE